MTREPNATDRVVEAVLATYRVPTLDKGFANRVIAAAQSQKRLAAAVPWPRPGRRSWRRSSIWFGFIALNIVAASAVAAMIGGTAVWHHVAEIAQTVASKWNGGGPNPLSHRQKSHLPVAPHSPPRTERLDSTLRVEQPRNLLSLSAGADARPMPLHRTRPALPLIARRGAGRLEQGFAHQPRALHRRVVLKQQRMKRAINWRSIQHGRLHRSAERYHSEMIATPAPPPPNHHEAQAPGELVGESRAVASPGSPQEEPKTSLRNEPLERQSPAERVVQAPRGQWRARGFPHASRHWGSRQGAHQYYRHFRF